MKKTFFILFFLVICLSLLFFFRVPLIQNLSPKLAKHYGFDISHVEVSQIDVDKIVVPMLVMQHVDGSISADIEIHNLVVDFDTYKAEVSSVSSSYVYINVDSIGEGDSATNQQSMKDAVDLLPIFGINIERVEINYRENGNELARFEGKLRYAQQAILKGVFRSQDKINLEVDLSVNESDFTLDVSEGGNEKSVIALTGDYHVEDDWLDVRLNGGLSFTAINQFLSVFGVDEYVQEDVSDVKGRFELDLTGSAQRVMQSFAADMDVDSTLSISSKNIGVRQAQIDVSASCRIEKLEVVDCSFKDPQRAVIDFYKMPDWLADYFSGIESKYAIEINPSDQLAMQVSFKEILAAKVNGGAAINMHSQSSRLRVGGLLSDINLNGVEQDWQLNVGYELKLEALELGAPAKISRLLLDGKGKLTADEQKLNIDVDKSFVVNALGVSYEGYETKKVQLKQLEDAQISYHYESNNVNADDVKVSLSFNQWRKAEVEFESAPIQLNINSVEYSDTKQKFVAKIDVDNMQFRQRGIPVSVYKLSVDADLSDNQLSVGGGIELGEQKHLLKFTASHDLLAGLGSGSISGHDIGLASNEIITSQISDSGFPLQLKGGKLDVDVDAIWNVNNAASEIYVKLFADGVMGDYAQNQFSNLNAKLEFVGQDGWRLKQAANIDIGVVNVGVPLEDVSMSLERMEYGVQDQPLIKLRNLSAAALDGSIYSKLIEVDLNRRENMFSIFLSSLSLEKLIALNQTEDLVASGRLDGELPMRLDNGVLLVDGGWLRADEGGGYIKYGRIGEVLAGNENLQLVGELLEDFQYNEMSAQVDLVPGGGLTLATKLHGRSPNATLNKQVNLNFNIDFNLWKFLESARLLTRIDQDVSEQILSNQKQ